MVSFSLCLMAAVNTLSLHFLRLQYIVTNYSHFAVPWLFWNSFLLPVIMYLLPTILQLPLLLPKPPSLCWPQFSLLLCGQLLKFCMGEGMWHLFFCIWLIALSIMSSRPSMCLQMTEFHSFFFFNSFLNGLIVRLFFSLIVKIHIR
jgi:hypothetical protein